MIYTAPDGIHVLDMATRKTRLLVPNPPRDPSRPHAVGRRRQPHALVAGSQNQQRLLHPARPRHQSRRRL